MILALSILLAGFSIAGCSSSKNADANTSKSSISGDIVVITNDAGSIDTLFKDYEKRFKEKYPEVNSVRFEAVQDYDNNMRTRMSTKTMAMSSIIRT